MADDGLADMIEASLAASGQNGARLELEITEIALVRQHAAALAALKRLQALGVLITMDNYGTGYASLSHLRNFPFDRIKLDQSFVGAMIRTRQKAGPWCGPFCGSRADLGIATTAEGVESRVQLEQLAANGCAPRRRAICSVRHSPPAERRTVCRLLAGGALDAVIADHRGMFAVTGANRA